MADANYTLEYKGKPMATITSIGYDTPTHGGKCKFYDKEALQQLIKAQEFTQWVETQPDDLSDEDYDAEMKHRGLKEEYDNMWNSSEWAIRDDKDQVTKISLLNLDVNGLEWHS